MNFSSLRTYLVGILLLFSNLCFSQLTKVVKDGKIDLDIKKGDIYELKGEWEFYWMQTLSSDEIHRIPQSKRLFLESPKIWTNLPYNGEILPAHGFATYYVRIHITDPTRDLGLRVGNVSSAAKYWVNGKLIGSMGVYSEHKKNEVPGFHPQIFRIHPDSEWIELVIQVSNFSFWEGGLHNVITIGDYDTQLSDWIEWSIISFFLVGSILIMSLYHFGLYFRRKDNLSALIFGVFCLLIAIRVPFNGEFYGNQLFSLPWQLIKKIDFGGYYFALIMVILFVRELYKSVFATWLYRAMLWFAFPFGLAVLVLPYKLYSQTLTVYQIFTLFTGVVLVVILIRSIRKNLDGAAVFFAGFIILFLTAINDILHTNHIIATTHVVHYGLFVFIFSQAFLLASRFSASFDQVERLADELNLSNLHLEEIVNVRTQSLQLANKELTKLSMVADKAANGVIIVTPGGIIEWVNTGFSELLGYKLDDLSRLFNLNIHNIDRVGDFKAAFDYTVQNGVIMLHDGYFFHIGGDKVWLQTTMSPVTNELGVVTHVVGIMADIRRLKNAESEISQQKQELESQRDNLIAQRDQILIQNKRITASLTYARNIQNAILPAREYMEELFSELCIVNMPKDIVSGDFYWAIRRGHQIIVAVADCTGHGVPGAFMSMLGVTLLKQVCLEDSNNNNTTGQILSSLRNYLKRALRQTEQSVTSRDGMDMSLCVIDEKEKTLQFSGAYNSLIFANKNGVEVIKGDKMPVGIFRKEKPVFETHTRNYKEGDAIYLFTDGYVDQFYLDTFEKYGSRRLVATIEAFDGMSMKVQERQFLKNYFDWRGNFQQIDDVLLLGARL